MNDIQETVENATTDIAAQANLMTDQIHKQNANTKPQSKLFPNVVDPHQYNAPFNRRINPFDLPLNGEDGDNNREPKHKDGDELSHEANEEWGRHGPKMKHTQHGSRPLPPIFPMQLVKHVKVPYSKKPMSANLLWH